MALVWVENWERISNSTSSSSESLLNDYISKNLNRNDWATNGEPQLHVGRLSSKSISIGAGSTGDSNFIEVPAGGTSEVILGFSYKPPIYRNANQNDWIKFYEYDPANSTPEEQVQLELADCGFIVRKGTSGRIAELMGAFYQERWNQIEIRIVFDNSAGVLQIRVNGDLLIDKSGIDTNQGNNTCNVIRIHGTESPTTTDEKFLGLIDDIYVLDETGSIANSSIAPNVFIESLGPTADGDSTDFTPSSGANYTNVDESQPSGTDYNSSGTSGDLDLFEMADLGIVGGAVYGVQVRNVVINDAPGYNPVIPKIKENGQEGSGDTWYVLDSDDYSDIRHIFTSNPDTATAWTVSTVNSMQCGYEIG